MLKDCHLTIRLVFAKGRTNEELIKVDIARHSQNDGVHRIRGNVENCKTRATVERPGEDSSVAVNSSSGSALSPRDVGDAREAANGESVLATIRVAVAVAVHNHQVELRGVSGKISGLSEVDERGVLNLTDAHEGGNLVAIGECRGIEASAGGAHNEDSLNWNCTRSDVGGETAVLGLSGAVLADVASIARADSTRSATAIARATVEALGSKALRVKLVARDDGSLDSLSVAVGQLNDDVTSDAGVRHALHVESRAISISSDTEVTELGPQGKIDYLDVEARVLVNLRRRRRRPVRRRGRRRRRRGRGRRRLAAETAIVHPGRSILAGRDRAGQYGGLTKNTLLIRGGIEWHLRDGMSGEVEFRLSNSQECAVVDAERGTDNRASR